MYVRNLKCYILLIAVALKLCCWTVLSPGRHCIFFSALQLFTFLPGIISVSVCFMVHLLFTHNISSKLQIWITKAHYFLPYLLLGTCHQQKLKHPEITAYIFFSPESFFISVGFRTYLSSQIIRIHWNSDTHLSRIVCLHALEQCLPLLPWLGLLSVFSL